MASARVMLEQLRWQFVASLMLKGAAAVASFALNWLIARAFGADGVGRFATALTTATLASTLCLGGVNYVLVRVVSVEKAAGRLDIARAAIKRGGIRTLLISSVVATLLFLGRDKIASDWMGEPSLAPYIGIMAFAVPMLALTILASGILRALNHIVWAQIAEGPAGTALAALLLGGALLLGFGLPGTSSALVYLTGWCVTTLWVSALLISKVGHWPKGGKFDESLAKSGLPILCVVLSNIFVDWFATVVISAHAGPAEAGLFRIAFQFAAMLNLVVSAVDSVLGPEIARSYSQGNRARVAQVSWKAAIGTTVLASPLLAAMLFTPHLLLGIFGEQFLPAANTLRVLALAQIANLVTGPVGTILIMAKRERWAMGYGVAGAVVSALVTLWLVPRYGAMGGALAVASSTILRRVAGVIIVRNVVGIHFIRDGLRRLGR